MRNLTKTDEAILVTAQKVFLENGILGSEMRDIATKVGCSRSTLYRHFNSKETILIYLAERAVDVFSEALLIPKGVQFESGFDALSWQLHSFVDSMISHVEEITFIRDFDCMFTNQYPQIPESSDFQKRVSGHEQDMGAAQVQQSIQGGINDGSIKVNNSPYVVMQTLIHSCYGIATRILPRENVYRQEHGIGREMLYEHVDILLEGLRNK